MNHYYLLSKGPLWLYLRGLVAIGARHSGCRAYERGTPG